MPALQNIASATAKLQWCFWRAGRRLFAQLCSDYRFFWHLPIAEVVGVALVGAALSLWPGRSMFEATLSGGALSRMFFVCVMLFCRADASRTAFWFYRVL